MRISTSERGQAWLQQFRPADVAIATELLDRVIFVPTSEFRHWLGEEIVRQANIGRLALYGEREFTPNSRFFPQLQPGRVRRAVGGLGPALVKPTRGSPYVGSEGIVAQLVSEIAKRKDVAALLTPGPDRLRPIKTRGPTHRLAIVTDVIGSGNRIRRMLDAMWRTETIRSWHAHRRVPLEVLVIAYAATAAGLENVSSHRLRPAVIHRQMVPTIWDISEDSQPFVNLCAFYEPKPTHTSAGPNGYGDAGTLIAFGHGCPNTAPSMLWHAGRRWSPLFPARSAVQFDSIGKSADVTRFSEQLLASGRPSLANASLLSRFGELTREALLLLAIISHARRDDLMLASRTGLDVVRVKVLLAAFREAGWIGASNGITMRGLAELRAAERVMTPVRDIPFDKVSVYFPTSLRG